MKAKSLSQLADLLAGYTAPTVNPTAKKVRRAANDNKPADVLAWPALERLAHRGDLHRVNTLKRWRDLTFPQDVIVAEDDGDYQPEYHNKFRPSEAELLAAVGRSVVDRERWQHTGEMVNVYDDTPPPPTKYKVRVVGRAGTKHRSLEARIGGLTFANGELKFWGITARGRPLKPDERSGGEKGSAKESGRSESDIRSYLSIKGAVSPLAAHHLQRLCRADQRDACEPSPEATAARHVLQSFGVDGSVPFERLPFPAARYPDAIVLGKQWVGGVKQPKPTASKPAMQEPDLSRRIETLNFVDYLRDKLGGHAKVLDMAITDATATNIGMSAGLAPAYAEKRGTALIEAALDALAAELRKVEDEERKTAA